MKSEIENLFRWLVTSVTNVVSSPLFWFCWSVVCGSCAAVNWLVLDGSQILNAFATGLHIGLIIFWLREVVRPE